MPYEDRAVTALEAVADRKRAAERGWALDWYLHPVKQRVFNIAGRGLTEFADGEDRAALSAWEGRAALSTASAVVVRASPWRPAYAVPPDQPDTELRLSGSMR